MQNRPSRLERLLEFNHSGGGTQMHELRENLKLSPDYYMCDFRDSHHMVDCMLCILLLVLRDKGVVSLQGV